ncbi:MAG: hypothetical protein Q9201_004671 [Fulgogasparrea decipioides]
MSLLNCNRQTRHEISEVMAREKHSRTFTHRLECALKKNALQPTWTLFPGPPQLMRRVEVDFILINLRRNRGFFWGAGGPGLVFKPLFELLNRFIHHGYQFFYTGPLQYEIHLESLVINMEWGNHNQDEDEIPLDDIPKSRERAFHFIVGHLKDVARMGLLTGKIDRIGVRYGEMQEIVCTDTFEPFDRVSAEWEKYGFHWGVDALATRPESVP